MTQRQTNKESNRKWLGAATFMNARKMQRYYYYHYIIIINGGIIMVYSTYYILSMEVFLFMGTAGENEKLLI